MGAKSSKKNIEKLTKADLNFLETQTGMNKKDVEAMMHKFSSKNSNGKLNKDEFIELYSSLRSEPKEQLDEIADSMFNGFDTNKDGFISFREFMVSNIY
jgi:neuronal calcium sensor 1